MCTRNRTSALICTLKCPLVLFEGLETLKRRTKRFRTPQFKALDRRAHLFAETPEANELKRFPLWLSRLL